MSELSVYGPGVRVQGLVLGGVNYCRSHCRSREILWLHVRGNTALWLDEQRVFCMCPVWISRLWFLSSQSQRCISTCISNYEVFAKRQCERQ